MKRGISVKKKLLSSSKSSSAQEWRGPSKATTAAQLSGLSNSVFAIEVKRMEIELILAKDNAARLRLYKTSHALDKALEILGWELADG